MLQYPMMAAVLGLIAALYGTYAQYDFSSGWLIRLCKRMMLSGAFSVVAIGGMWFWTTFYYPVTLIHLLGTCSFTFAYMCSDRVNAALGTPISL